MNSNCRAKLVVSSLIFLCACASPTVVSTVKPGDNGLSCAQLQNEYADAERFHVEAEKEKGVTGGNVARALLFWPAIIGSYSNANEAIAAADTRKAHLSNLMNQKNCSGATSASATEYKTPDNEPVAEPVARPKRSKAHSAEASSR